MDELQKAQATVAERLRDIAVDNFLLILFMVVYLVAWSANAVAGAKFALQDLNVLAWLLGGQHGINSVFNTAIPMVNQIRGAQQVPTRGVPL